MLIAVAIIGLIYAIPNLYSEHPVVQVSSDVAVAPEVLETNVRELLTKANLEFGAITPTRDGLEVRFATPDTQLLARDVIKKGLGSQYTVALNLASSTPAWLTALHAEPMKQGLDLRGGVHFLLEVDIDSVISRRYEGITKSIGQDLRTAGIRYSGIRYIVGKGIDVRFRTADAVTPAMNILRTSHPGLEFSHPQEGFGLIASLSPAELNTIRQNTIEQTMGILRNRVNELGVGEAVVQQQGGTRVAVDLPGIQDAARAKQILGGTATLQFHLVDQEADAQIAKRTGAVPVGSKLFMMDGQPILLKRQVVLSGDSITSAGSTFDQQTATTTTGGEATIFYNTFGNETSSSSYQSRVNLPGFEKIYLWIY